MPLRSLPTSEPVAPPAMASGESSAREAENLGIVRKSLQVVAYPLLLIAAVGTGALAICRGLPFPSVLFAFTVGSFCYLVVLERIIPFDRAWYPQRWEWRRDGVYYMIIVTTGAAARAAVLSIGRLIAPLRTNLPLWAEIPASILIVSLASFLFHRLGHRLPWLWEAHGVHHVPNKVNVSNNNVNHFIDVFGNLFVAQIPLILLGASQPAMFAAALFKSAQGYGVHANINVKLGWLGYLLVTPEMHRLHHSAKPEEAGHFGADLAIWDLLSGSFTWSAGKTPAEVGVTEPASFPPTRAVFANQAHPFRRWIRRKERPA